MPTDFIFEALKEMLHVALQTAPFWAPVGLLLLAAEMWKLYINKLHLQSLKWTMLEVRIPKDVFKTPLAMELVLINAFHQGGGVGTWFHRWWLGALPATFSLEIASLGGKVYFFIRTQPKFKQLIESQIYSQYPQAEINEVDDYVDAIVAPHESGSEWKMWGTEFKLATKDVYPIKTYIDYGLDKATSLDEEQKIDPITTMLEHMGSITPNEQMWFQIMIRITTKRFGVAGEWFGKQDWTKSAEEEIKKIMSKPMFAPEKDDKGKSKAPTAMNLSTAQKEKIDAIERSIQKPAFDVGIRGIYLAKGDSFNAINMTALTGAFKQYGSANLNGFRATNVTDVDIGIIHDPFKRIVPRKKMEMFNAYRARGYFYHPYKLPPFILNAEELATIYHFPGRVSETPSFARIEALKAEPPVNLPT